MVKVNPVTWLLILCLLCVSQSSIADQPVSKIINGQPASLGDHDYFVSILYKFEWGNGYHYLPFCGGAYMGDGLVLTAAHCIDGLRPSSKIYLLIGNNSTDFEYEYCKVTSTYPYFDLCRTSISLGYGPTNNIVYTGDESELIEVEGQDFLAHFFYDANTFKNDIALTYLNELPGHDSLNFPEVDTFNVLAQAGSSDSVLVIGHGDVISDDDEDTFLQSRDLLEVAITPKTDDFCSSKLGGFSGPSMVCAGDPGEDSCQGDSGGPLIDPETKTLLGIVSWGYTQCGNPIESHGVYTDVYQYKDWIATKGGTLPFQLKSDSVVRMGNIDPENTGSLGLLILLSGFGLILGRRK